MLVSLLACLSACIETVVGDVQITIGLFKQMRVQTRFMYVGKRINCEIFSCRLPSIEFGIYFSPLNALNNSTNRNYFSIVTS